VAGLVWYPCSRLHPATRIPAARSSVEIFGTSFPLETSYNGVITLDAGK